LLLVVVNCHAIFYYTWHRSHLSREWGWVESRGRIFLMLALANPFACIMANSRSLKEQAQDFVKFHSHGFHVFKRFANETDIGCLLSAVTTSCFEPNWVEIHNWNGEKSTAKRWMAHAPECAQLFFDDHVVPFLKKRGFYTTQHDISLGRGVAVLRFFYDVFMCCI
jgi:hypothetical protein